MKHLSGIYTGLLLAVVTGFVLVGCSKKGDSQINPFNPAEINLQVVSADVVYGAGGGSGAIQMNSSDFTFTLEDDWLTAEKAGNKINLTVRQNGTPNLRTAMIKIKDATTEGEGNVQMVSVSQYGVANIMDISPIYASLKGQTITFDLSKVVDPVKITFPNGENEWIKYSIDGKTLKIEVLPTSKDRSGEIVITAGVMKKVVPVTQQVQYADLIGSYNANFLLEFNWKKSEQNQTWTLSPLEEGKSFVLSGFGMDLIVNYDAANRTLILPVGIHDLKGNPQGVALAAWVAGEFGSGSLWPHTDFYFEAPMNTETPTPEFKFAFKTKGTKYTIEIDGKDTEVFPKGMILWGNSGQYKPAEGKFSQLCDLTLTKI
ncbi:MAG: hypothetical protein MR609_04080 [Bacteroidales bacterium]|nr:hypothetical protein [Bacteroidales bacterium]